MGLILIGPGVGDKGHTDRDRLALGPDYSYTRCSRSERIPGK